MAALSIAMKTFKAELYYVHTERFYISECTSYHLMILPDVCSAGCMYCICFIYYKSASVGEPHLNMDLYGLLDKCVKSVPLHHVCACVNDCMVCQIPSVK